LTLIVAIFILSKDKSVVEALDLFIYDQEVMPFINLLCR